MSSPDFPEAGMIVFLRLPEKGKVKTRLAATVGQDAALDIYKKLISITLENVRNTRWPAFLFYNGGLPDISEMDPACTYDQQVPGDLGIKMADAISRVLTCHLKAIIIGSDCPGLSPGLLNEAVSLLDETDVVIGPALDGGYYLLGCKKYTPSLFHNIDWSTPSVFSQTMEAARENNLTIGLLPVLPDIDTEDDWNLYSTITRI